MGLEMPDRTRARQLASEYYAKGDPTGWFEQLYREAEEGKSTVPWADHKPSSVLVDFCTDQYSATAGKSALTVGCGFGDDAEQLAVLLAGLLGDDQDIRAEFDEGVGDRESGDADTEDRDAQVAPVGVPAGEGREVGHD